MSQLIRDQNRVTVAGGQSSADSTVVLPFTIDAVTGRVLTDMAGGGTGTVTSVSVVTANGLAGTVATATTTPAITLSTTITGILKGNGTAISAGVAGDVDSILPTQTGNNGKVLSTNGSTSSWISSGGTGTVTSVASADSSITVTNPTTTVDLAVVKAPKWSTARNLAGNSVDGSANVAFSNKFIVQGTTDAGLSGAQFLGALGTGIVKNTTTTGVLSIAAAGTDYEVPLTFSTGLTRTTNTITVNTSQNIATLSNLTSNGLVTTSGGVGTLGVTVPGTGVLTALAVNVGSAGAFVTFNGALGTPSSGTLTNATGYTVANLSGAGSGVLTFLATPTSANLAAAVTNETGTGALVFATSPALVTVAETGIGTADLLAANQNTVTVTSNAGSTNQAFMLQKFTNSSAATMTITLPVATPTPKDGQFQEVRIYDFSAVTQTIAWVNTENSTVNAPTTSNGSTTLPLSVLFQFNAATSKWRCIAIA